MAAKELGIDVLTVKSEQGCDTCSKETSIDLTQPNYVARIPHSIPNAGVCLQLHRRMCC